LTTTGACRNTTDMPTRPKKLTVMLSREEEKSLKAEAERRGLTLSDVIRQSIRDAAPPENATQRRAQSSIPKARA
jgi:hypothetical protein